MRRLTALVADRDFGAPALVVLVLLLVTAALIGVAVGAAVPAAALALLLAFAGAWLLSSLVAAQARALAESVESITGSETDVQKALGPRQEWRELGAAIDRLVASQRTQASRLVEERVRSQRLLEELPSAVVLFDEDDLVYANRAAEAMFGLPPRLQGGVAAEVFTDPAAKTLRDAVEETRAVGRVIDVEVERDGAILAARTATAGAGEVVLVVRDVTGARRLAAVRRDFVVNASHELKTPVAGIQALAESLALALQHDPARAERMVTRIGQEAGRLARLVRDLLDLARLEERDDDQDRRRVDVVAIVEGQLERLRATATEQRIEMTADLAEHADIIAVPEDVRSIVANLLDNAVRYNREGGTVGITLHRLDGSVVLEVADSGLGIPPQDQQRIFERFYRVDKARSRAAGGTGLGLALTRHAVDRLGGSIHVDSEPGVGSTFRVELPVAADSD